MIARAQHKYLGVSAQKTRLVVDQVRGKNVGDALSILHFSEKRVARDVEKVAKMAGAPGAPGAAPAAGAAPPAAPPAGKS